MRLRPAPLIWPPLNIAHRGAAGDAPENTMAAFELALRHGADGIELDVHLSADGVPVVIHDARLRRTTSGNGRVADHSLKALRRLDAGSWFNQRYPTKSNPRYANRKIPSLREVLEWVSKQQCLAYVEIKKTRQRYPGIEAKVAEEIHRTGAAPLSTIISFDFLTLRRVREVDPRMPLGFDCTRPLLAIRRAGLIGASSIIPHWAFASRRFLARAHRAGIRVLVWDLDQAHWMRRKISEGVDGVITRYPGRLAGILKDSGTRIQDSGRFVAC